MTLYPNKIIRGLILLLTLILCTYFSEAQTENKISQIETLLKAYKKADQLNGVVLVAKNGESIYQGAFGFANMEWKTPVTTDTKFQIASITKAFTAVLIMQLVEKRLINLNDFAAKYIPDLPSETTSKFTIAQLLEHSSGLPRDIADFPTSGNNFPDVVAKINEEFFSLEEVAKMIVARKLVFEPGTNYGYSSDGYTLLGYIAQKVSGKSYEDLLQQQILAPLGMSQTYYKTTYDIVGKRADGYVQNLNGLKKSRQLAIAPSGGILSTVSDLLKWEQSFNTNKLLSNQSKKEIFKERPFIVTYGWKHCRMPLAPGDTLKVLRTDGAFPGFNSLLIRDTISKTTIVILENIRNISYKQEDIAIEIFKILNGKKPTLPKSSLAFSFAKAASTDDINKLYREKGKYYADETEINNVGYHFLNSKNDAQRAILVFKINTQLFPNSANTFDSLGETYMTMGDKENAIKCYETCLRINPAWESATQMLKKLRQ